MLPGGVYRGPLRDKMGIGIGRFCPGKMGFKPNWDWYLVTGNGKKYVKNQKWEWDLRTAKLDLEKK